MSALLDGQLPPDEVEEAWAHVYACHACRDEVEREGWVKAQLAGAARTGGVASTPDHLKGALRDLTPGERFALDSCASAVALRGRSGAGRRTVAVVGSGAAGAAMLGVLALGLAPASTHSSDRRPPPSGVTAPSPSSTPGQRPAPARAAVSESSTPSTPAPSLRMPGLRLPAVDQW